jgi:two-component system, NarL family, response regulator LiaR
LGQSDRQFKLTAADTPTGATITVVIVDDHDLYRTGLAALLGAEPDIEILGGASGGRRGVRLVGELRPTVVLMDLRMPDLDGSKATREIIEQQPGARVVVLTVLADDEAVADALNSGACGFLAKDSPVEDIAAAVRAAARGAAWLAPRAAEVVLARVRRTNSNAATEHRAHDELSSRELDVLRLVARGLANAEIAVLLGISPRTVKNHVSNILAKLEVSSRIQAAVYAVRKGLD